ncbi:MAG: insulinase family protein, partial [Crocinitomicaceae bacterium]
FRLFQSELETVYEEKNRSMDDGFSSVYDLFLKNFFKNHPYGQQTILGSTEHLKNPSLSKMYEFFNTYYVANNMALILSGDFDIDKIIPLIEDYFGKWRTGTIPTFPHYQEDDFKGVESVNVKATPVKVGIRGYRTPANGTDDQIAIHLANYMLSNSESSGLFDNLNTEGKLLMIGMEPMDYNDYSSSIIYYVPKILGQSFDDAQALIDAKLNKLKTGDFDTTLLEAAKLSMLKEFQTSMESNEDRAYLIADIFTQNRTWESLLESQKKMLALTKEDIVNIVKKYYGDNYLELHSTTGHVKQDKLKKPGFKPVIPEPGKHSIYNEEWSKIGFTPVPATNTDFAKEIQSTDIQKNVHLQVVKNPFNDIFELAITFGTGKYYDPNLMYSAGYLTSVNAKDMTSTELLAKLATWGATFYASGSEEDKFKLVIEGYEPYLDSILFTLNNYFNNIQADKDSYEAFYEQELGNRKVNFENNSAVLSALKDYAVFGNQSPLNRAYSKKEFQANSGDSLMKSFHNAMKYEWDIAYTGKLPLEKVKSAITTYFPPQADIQPKQADVILAHQLPKTPTVYFIDDKKAVQTQFLFLQEGSLFNKDSVAIADAFNVYFGGDMSSLVFQEIREFRSLAYSTYGDYSFGENKNHLNAFWSFVGCQGDKTQEALSVMYGLIKEMPQKPKQIDAIVASLINEANSSKPGFRDMIDVVNEWKEKGYDGNPNPEKMKIYKTITFEDIYKFYQSEILPGTVYLVVVGNSKKFDKNILKTYGNLVEMKKTQLMP